MTTLQILNFLRSHKEEFRQKFGITKLGLFGSYARGEATKDSDIDIGLHVGGRWFWNDKWGVYLELGGGSTQGATGGLGLTIKL